MPSKAQPKPTTKGDADGDGSTPPEAAAPRPSGRRTGWPPGASPTKDSSERERRLRRSAADAV